LLNRNIAKQGMLTGEQVAVSALTGAGSEALLGLLDRLLSGQEQTMRLHLAPEDGAGLAWAYANARVLDRREGEKGVYLVVAAAPPTVDRFLARFPKQLTIVEERERFRAASS